MEFLTALQHAPFEIVILVGLVAGMAIGFLGSEWSQFRS